jgi:hypothetical protein
MSVQFYAATIVALAEDFKTMRSSGLEFKAGQVFCQDHQGNWYYSTMPFDIQSTDPKGWPRKGKKGIQLYRDYWKHLASATPDCAFGRAFLAAPKTVIK